MNHRLYRPEDALLAGVCAELGKRLGWNVWALRALFLAGLLVQTLPTVAIYGVAALIMALALGRGSAPRPSEDRICSESLSDRARRIEELEAKFRDLERDRR
jgi:phage shock protein PspC (stress-responsive transcriptional regulator)